MRLEPSPQLCRPPEAAPLTVPTPDLWVDLGKVTQASFTGLSERMSRQGGWQGWWRKHFGPKPREGNEVLGHARRIGARLATAYLGANPADRALMPAQIAVFVHRSVNQAFRNCSYPARKEWARRVAGSGVGDFRRARQQLAREAGPLPLTPGRPDERIDVRQLEAQLAQTVLRALIAAARQS